MDTSAAELSSLSSVLDDLQHRIAQVAAQYEGSPREDVAAGLFEVERSLSSAGRRLAKILRDIRP